MQIPFKTVLRELGFLIPRTEEELDAFKIAAKNQVPPLPEKLRSPWSFKNRSNKPLEIPRSQLLNTDVDQPMAMAARNGKTLPPEILAKLKQNSEKTKRNDQ